ncbi:MAG: hypothetical protein KDK30_12860 [Leptospiraceae bacterium]|nr:hypothetical protein [Leptospiraceae bacterium]MCB1317944.1 hypothetical protein [Leptospiraceae bacterium]
MRTVILFSLICCGLVPFACKTEQAGNTANIPVARPPADSGPCNYYWVRKRRHFCIERMPVRDCEFLFATGDFIKDDHCVCFDSGREATRVQGSGYVQIDCAE